MKEKHRKHPRGDWPFYPRLKDGDITHEYWNSKRMIHDAIVNDRKGRVVVLFDHEKYATFLRHVKKRRGNIWASSVSNAIHEAIDKWISEGE